MSRRRRKRRYERTPLRVHLRRFWFDLVTWFLFFKEWIEKRKLPDIQYIKTRKSLIERRLYLALKQAGYRVYVEYPIGPNRCDLVLKKYQLVIECDSKYHENEKQKQRDRQKTRYLKKRKWKVLRFEGWEINQKLPQCLKKIEKEILA